jgi:hypothetical protein
LLKVGQNGTGICLKLKVKLGKNLVKVWDKKMVKVAESYEYALLILVENF